LSLTLLQEATEAAQGAEAVGHFEPFLPGLVVLLPFLGFLVNGVLALIAGRRAADATRAGNTTWELSDGNRPATHTLPSIVGPGVLLAAFVIVLVNFMRAYQAHIEAPVVVSYWTWIATGTFQVDAALQLDQLSLTMMMIVTGVGFLIHVFSVGYMKDDPGYPRYFAYLNLFVFFMLILVMGASFPLMFVGWEGVGLCSYLLIGFWFKDREKADAGKKAFIVNRIGDFGFLIALFLLFVTFGTLDFVQLFTEAPTRLAYGAPLVTAVTLFLLLGATGKSAQIPLYVWLPDAMAGPTPVSALIHAATMVTAGVYMVARSSVLFALAPVGGLTVAGIGALTALFAATIAIQQYDIKKVLAYSTVSQLGYMFLGVGVGAYTAGVFHLMTHAFFKALLFLGSGAVIHSMHHALHHTHKHWDAQDMRNMGGLRHHMPITWATMWIGTLAIAGIWPFAGFFSKDEIIWYAGAAAVGPYAGWYKLFWAIALAGAVMTAFYMTRMMVMTFHGANRTGHDEAHHLHEAPLTMTVPLIVLAVLSVFGGWINVPLALHEGWVGLFGALPMGEGLHHWLEPVVGPATEIRAEHVGEFAESAPLGGGELAWATISTLVAAVVVAGSIALVRGWAVRPATESVAPTGFARVLYHKWYVDELYDRIVVRPVVAGSRFLWRVVDASVVDGVVNATGSLSRAFGFVGSMLQTGAVNTYAFILAAGVVAILAAVAL
jgi:NADH-quinone oxidoreductase subunit L